MQETPKKKSALGWILCLISMAAVFCLGLLAASITERKAEVASIYNNKKVDLAAVPVESKNEQWGLNYPREFETWKMTAKGDFKSKYLDITVGVINPPTDTTPMAAEGELPYNDESGLEDIDFCLELLHSDVINVAYILELIANLNPDEEDYDKKRQDILDTMIKDAVMRNKSKLIDDFIRENVDNNKEGFQQAKADGSMDLESRLNDYIATSRSNAVHCLAISEDIDEEALNKFLSEFDYLHREKPEIIQKAIRAKKGLRLMERSTMLKRIIEQLREIINTYNWD